MIERARRLRLLLLGGACIGVMVIVASAIRLSSGSEQEAAGLRLLSGFALGGNGEASGEVQACGVAVDSNGGVYVATSRGPGIDVFDGEGELLNTIRSSNDPCSLAIDSGGNLYASELRTGRVVKYVPESYPFQGGPVYGSPVTVDASGMANGIAIDPVNDRLYIAKGDHLDVYGPDGSLGISETQRVFPFESVGGTFTLSFRGATTVPVPHDATHAELEAALADLPTIGSRNVWVRDGPNGNGDHAVTFSGALSSSDVPLLRGDASELQSRDAGNLYLEVLRGGFSGRVGDKVLSEASDVGVYRLGPGHYVFAADSAGRAPDRIEVFSGRRIEALEHRRTLGPPPFGPGIRFDSKGPRLSVDQSNGHIYVFDVDANVFKEFEATGPYVGQLKDPLLEPYEQIDIAYGPSSDRAMRVLTDGSSGAEIVAVAPAPAGHRQPLPGPSGVLDEACGVAVDEHGDVYVSSGTTIKIYDPDGQEIQTLTEVDNPCDLAVDSGGSIYAATAGGGAAGDERILQFEPASYPPGPSTRYMGPKTIRSYRWSSYDGLPGWIAVNPANDHLFANTGDFSIAEYGSAREGSRLIDDQLGDELLHGTELFAGGLDICGSSGEIYIAGRGSNGWRVYVLDAKGTALLEVIDGSDGPQGVFPDHTTDIAVDQSNCHLLVGNFRRAVEEFETSGAFLDAFGPRYLPKAIAIASGASNPVQGIVYLAPFTRGWAAFGAPD